MAAKSFSAPSRLKLNLTSAKILFSQYGTSRHGNLPTGSMFHLWPLLKVLGSLQQKSAYSVCRWAWEMQYCFSPCNWPFHKQTLIILSVHIAAVIFKVLSKYCCGLFVVLKRKPTFRLWLKWFTNVDSSSLHSCAFCARLSKCSADTILWVPKCTAGRGSKIDYFIHTPVKCSSCLSVHVNRQE